MPRDNYDSDDLLVDRLTHWYIIGRSQSGKTTYIKNLVRGDMEEPDRYGLCYIDLHGDAAQEILSVVPRERIPDVIYYDPLSPYAPAFNFLRLPGEPSKIAADLEALFKQISSYWGDRLGQLFRNCLLALMSDMRQHGNVWTLRHVKTFLLHKTFRDEITSRLPPALAEYWEYEFPTLGKDVINPVTNKLDGLMPPQSDLERIFSEPDNELDFFDIVNSGKILICRFSKGELTDEPAALLGIIFTRAIQQAGMARSTIPLPQRKPFFLLVDECQNLVASPLDSIMTETAKFRVFLTAANHRLSQFRHNPDLRDALLGATVLVAFHLEENDIHEFQKRMHRIVREYRVRNRGEWVPVSDLIPELRACLADKLEEYENLKEKLKDAYNSDQYQSYERRVNEIADALDALDYEHIGNDALSEIVHKEYGKVRPWRDSLGYLHEDKGTRLFPDMVFRDRDFPSYQEFADLERKNIFIRIDRASDVYDLATPPPPPEDPTVRHAILSQQQRRYHERMRLRKNTEQEHRHTANENERTPPPPRDTTKRKKKLQDDEDFLN